jgi:glycosyltransferase involved in cell wall biosynthesis
MNLNKIKSSRKSKNKILIFHPALAPYRVDFFNGFSEYFDTVLYFNHRNVTDQKFNQELLISLCTFKINYLDNGFEFFGRSIRFGISSIIKKENPDIIICSEYSFITILTFLYKFFYNKKYKIYILSDDSIDNSIDRNGLRKFLRNNISKRVEGIIFPSEKVCNWYKKEVSNKPKTLILPIIHNDKIFRKELALSLNKANQYIKQYNLYDKKVILFVGRLVEVKNIPILIKAFTKLEGFDVVLVIVGEGPLFDHLKDMVKTSNISKKVIFTGRKEGVDLVSWYAIAQLFVLPSTYEPFGAVVNEALLAGCEVLCSEKAGASSLMNLTNGHLFNPNNEKELVLHLINSLKDLKPISIENLKLRKSKMPFTFSEKIQELMIEFT